MLQPSEARSEARRDRLPALVVGAGATGLVAALGLARHGLPVRIVEKRDGPSPLSRAVGILPMSMPLLERAGVADSVRERAVAITDGLIFDHDREIARVPMDRLHGHRLYALPQDETETILADRLQEFGVEVEYGRPFEAFTQSESHVSATVAGETRRYSELLGADGARSPVREALGLPFEGYDLPSRWSIADIDVGADVGGTFRVHLLTDGEAVFAIPIGPQRLRVVATVPDALAALPVDPGTVGVRRAGDFTIAVRQVPRYRVGRVSLAGDAAHVHSPVGGRGMNLGMADAAEWARCCAAGTLSDYSAARHAAGREIIDFTETMRRRVMVPDSLKRRATLGALGLAIRLPPALQLINRRILLPGYEEARQAEAVAGTART